MSDSGLPLASFSWSQGYSQMRVNDSSKFYLVSFFFFKFHISKSRYYYRVQTIENSDILNTGLCSNRLSFNRSKVQFYSLIPTSLKVANVVLSNRKLIKYRSTKSQYREIKRSGTKSWFFLLLERTSVNSQCIGSPSTVPSGCRYPAYEISWPFHIR